MGIVEPRREESDAGLVDRGTKGGHEHDRRDAMRQPHSGPIWFRQPGASSFCHGWLVDHSPAGAAFLTRGRCTPLPGIRVEATTADPESGAEELRDGLISRVQHIHGELSLVAVQLKPPTCG